MIPYGKQLISEDDIDAVKAVLKSDYLTQGEQVPAFEQAIAQECKARYAVAVNSATSALHIACLALGVSNGDWVWTSPNTFVASANCARYCGAEVDFVDIDPQTYNMSVSALKEKLLVAEQHGKLPKVVIPVHFAGQPCDMKAIYQLSQQFGFAIIEDAAHAIGAQYQDQPVGSCRYSDVTVFSFHPVKIITTAEGGVAMTNQPGLAEKMKLLRSHGVTREPQLMYDCPSVDAERGAWFYQQVDLGFNYRMTDLQAALGLSQLKQLEAFVEKRHQLAQVYHQSLKNFPLKLPFQSEGNRSSYHLFPIQLETEVVSRQQFFDRLREKGLGVNVHYIPVHTQPYYQQRGFRVGDYPVAEAYYRKAISIPLHQGMTIANQATVIKAIKESLI
ncbi:UDP-4-amino-4,6-dideoxy-N-acetyl-beta-L-altrosamine transaminase [Hydrogenovibrio sp. SC-1]|uniref:UDP-4-amino-4, 6-dideoxy-N-acetyl-beta-L-altrosamine transaminase n=1 Tax=Hydrogenovibrio sp. SC-1 TaxID=2065820 RepID=UPI000C7E17F1|nr:UDP-4-amino-4,6-dideoxy-N-acetyl-beta-L-altrosamine transaminase [Hydrogenovibrio sp. SC-1]PLA74886.1 UDP-4-amino-4,6-dideoxy-N-acetyl-beta-L-altrosamine transaminase [Hydrogenovibrio sp. SC-1]